VKTIFLSTCFGLVVMGMSFLFDIEPEFRTHRLLIGCIAGLVFWLLFVFFGHGKDSKQTKIKKR
jgi:hypothetical protein